METLNGKMHVLKITEHDKIMVTVKNDDGVITSSILHPDLIKNREGKVTLSFVLKHLNPETLAVLENAFNLHAAKEEPDNAPPKTP